MYNVPYLIFQMKKTWNEAWKEMLQPPLPHWQSDPSSAYKWPNCPYHARFSDFFFAQMNLQAPLQRRLFRTSICRKSFKTARGTLLQLISLLLIFEPEIVFPIEKLKEKPETNSALNVASHFSQTLSPSFLCFFFF